MWNNRYNQSNYGGSSITKELEAIKESKLEREQYDEFTLKYKVEESFDGKLYDSLNKIILKVTKAS